MEQISALEMDRNISADTLVKYLPQQGSSLPAIYRGTSENTENLSERDLLYKVLFDMKKDMNDLKKLVHDLLESGQVDSSVIDDNPNLFRNMESNTSLPSESKPKEYSEPIYINSGADDNDEYDYENIHDITHEEDESLSIEEKEKELIIKALRKNNNKRKYAAQDLGISERTLYRKIKQYEID